MKKSLLSSLGAFSHFAAWIAGCLLSGTQPAQARSTPPPFIQDRSVGKVLAEKFEGATRSSASTHEINQQGRQLLADAYSAGGRRFQNNFPGGFHLDLSKPQFQRIATNLLRANTKNWHGYERELKYLNVIARRESPFRIVSVGTRSPIADGRLVEFDALLEDKKSHLRLSAEFKDWRIDSPEKLIKAKEQIDKISRRAREQGVSSSIWVNRARIGKERHRDLERYAAARQVTVYSPVTTSERLPRSLLQPRRFDDVLLKESRNLRHIHREQIAARGVGGMRWGQLAGRGAIVVGTAYGVWQTGHGAYQWSQGAITTRQAVVSVSEGIGSAAGGFAGGWAGAEAGAAVGTFIVPGPGTAVGAVIGGAIGGIGGAVMGAWSGKAVGTLLVDDVIFKDLDEKETDSLMAFLKQRYQAPEQHPIP